ncbi:MAG: EI24 domain-containing protein [Alphaproteobacteria bacterium]|nr:EI24 domain-containing protein [Alphaproteobacteria bacterium]
MISAFFKALGDLGSPRFRSVLWQTVFLSLVTAILLWTVISWLLFSTEVVGDLPWVGGAVEVFADVFGSVAAFALMILLLPAFLGLYASFYIETICRAVEARHYSALPPPREQGITEAIWVGIKFGLLLIALNLLLLPLLLLGPLYFIAAWGVNGYLLGREYLEMVGFRRMSPAELREFRLRHRSTVYFAGLVFAFIATVPILNLLLPLFGTAMMLHVYERQRTR